MFNIQRVKDGAYIHITIDSGGMDVFFTGRNDAHLFHTRENAEAFCERLKERYPDAQMMIVEAY